MKAPITIGLQAGSKQLVLHRTKANIHGCNLGIVGYPGYWDLWLHTRDYKLGTFVRMYDNGKVERHTIRDEPGCDEIVLIKPEDGIE